MVMSQVQKWIRIHRKFYLFGSGKIMRVLWIRNTDLNCTRIFARFTFLTTTNKGYFNAYCSRKNNAVSIPILGSVTKENPATFK